MFIRRADTDPVIFRRADTDPDFSRRADMDPVFSRRSAPDPQPFNCSIGQVTLATIINIPHRREIEN